MQDVKVSVICKTYNHERYIAQCLDSLVSQVTDFKYEIIVHDDASTDATADIVREYEAKYPDLIVPIYQTENKYQKKIDTYKEYILPLSKGALLAMCEGDDFWTDTSKLQRQYDFMSTHPEYSLCGHGAYYANEDGSLQTNNYFTASDESRDISIEEILGSWKMATASLMYRKDLRIAATPIPFKGDCPNGDFALAVYMSLHGKVYYMKELMAAYRKNSVGSLNWVWRNDLEKGKANRFKFVEMLERIDEYSGYKYHEIIEKNKAHNLFYAYLIAGDVKNAKKYPDLYATLSTKVKLKVVIKSFSPKIYARIRNSYFKFKYRV